jgi:hypothetical protein
MQSLVLIGIAFCATPSWSQTFTTAAEVSPILDMTRANWIGIRDWEGQDYLYFSHLSAFRCGLDEIAYSVNDGPVAVFAAEPCYEAEAAPNAMKMENGDVPFVIFPPGTLQKVAVTVKLDDGSVLEQVFERAAVMIP